MTQVLVVEDEPALASLLRRVLERHGHDVRLAVSLAEGKEALTAALPDLLLLDLGLPDGDGADLLPALQGTPVRTVVVTAQTDRAVQQRCLDAGAYAVLLKPFELAALLALVTEALTAP